MPSPPCFRDLCLGSSCSFRFVGLSSVSLSCRLLQSLFTNDKFPQMLLMWACHAGRAQQRAAAAASGARRPGWEQMLPVQKGAEWSRATARQFHARRCGLVYRCVANCSEEGSKSSENAPALNWTVFNVYVHARVHAYEQSIALAALSLFQKWPEDSQTLRTLLTKLAIITQQCFALIALAVAFMLPSIVHVNYLNLLAWNLLFCFKWSNLHMEERIKNGYAR